MFLKTLPLVPNKPTFYTMGYLLNKTQLIQTLQTNKRTTNLVGWGLFRLVGEVGRHGVSSRRAL